ncbi:hypothetical protein J2X31_001342 [Flavobacterium arsenatis]|uniref:C1q domain-containing protein n=1 Tax=Flavobacterium arsenatis TaxID=1484332 RepID=A0ABU1TMZ8_9FLAO|nr:hypothetical protein [Flavobacterium arsenatis]MDR6967335.1 hypothetical protein [Flavobacterium arsenatis]
MNTITNKVQLLASVFIVGVFSITQAVAQTGVGTLNPTNSMDIVTNAGNVIISNTGQLGVLVANPKVALDLRSGGANGSFAIGMTNQTAVQAGAGALRYNPSPAIGVNGYLEFSDGTDWIGFFPFGKPRIVVMAEKTTQNTVVFEPGGVATGNYNGMPPRSSAYLTNWTEKLDSDSGTPTNNFDPATGEFIAPRTGVYFATFTFALADNNVNTGANNQVEAIWEVRNPANQIIQRVKTNNGYPSDSGGGTVKVGAQCTVSVYLNQGDKLRPFSWCSVSFGTDMRTFDVSGGYNVLTIVEQ